MEMIWRRKFEYSILGDQYNQVKRTELGAMSHE
jgi:hypothetical protein